MYAIELRVDLFLTFTVTLVTQHGSMITISSNRTGLIRVYNRSCRFGSASHVGGLALEFTHGSIGALFVFYDGPNHCASGQV